MVNARGGTGVGRPGSTPARGRAGPRRQHREVAAAGAPAHHPHLAGHHHVPVADPARFPFQAVEHHAQPRCVVVGEHRLHQHLPQRRNRPVADRLLQRVGRKAPDIVRPGGGIRSNPFLPPLVDGPSNCARSRSRRPAVRQAGAIPPFRDGGASAGENAAAAMTEQPDREAAEKLFAARGPTTSPTLFDPPADRALVGRRATVIIAPAPGRGAVVRWTGCRVPGPGRGGWRSPGRTMPPRRGRHEHCSAGGARR